MEGKRFAVLFTLLVLLSLSLYASTSGASSEVHDVAVANVSIFPTLVIGGGYISSNVTVENQGTRYETFNVTLYAGNVTVQNFTVTNLPPGTNTTVALQWSMFPFRGDIFGPPPYKSKKVYVANFTIKAEADAVSGEIDVADNVYVDGTLTVKLAVADYYADGKIDIKDLTIVAKAFGSYPGADNWNPIVDINVDSKIDMRDITSTAVVFGWTYA